MDVDLQDAAPGHGDEAQGQIAQGSRALPDGARNFSSAALKLGKNMKCHEVGRKSPMSQSSDPSSRVNKGYPPFRFRAAPGPGNPDAEVGQLRIDGPTFREGRRQGPRRNHPRTHWGPQTTLDFVPRTRQSIARKSP